MATIQVRDVPESSYEVIRRRARAQGQSIQAYMREQIIALTSRRTKSEALAEVEAALARDVFRGADVEDIVADLDAERR